MNIKNNFICPYHNYETTANVPLSTEAIIDYDKAIILHLLMWFYEVLLSLKGFRMYFSNIYFFDFPWIVKAMEIKSREYITFLFNILPNIKVCCLNILYIDCITFSNDKDCQNLYRYLAWKVFLRKKDNFWKVSTKKVFLYFLLKVVESCVNKGLLFWILTIKIHICDRIVLNCQP